MTIRGGERCKRPSADGRLCSQHATDGAVIPDGWAGELPVFHIARRPKPAPLVPA